MITHIHHIIPRHAGGTDDPINLIALTVEEHAEAHKQLWLMNRDWRDEIAWLALSGQISGAEAHLMAIKKANSHPLTPEHKAKVIKTLNHGKGSDNNMIAHSGAKKHIGMKRSREAVHNISKGNTGTKRTLSKKLKIKKKLIIAKNREKSKSFQKYKQRPNMDDAQKLYDNGLSYKKLAEHYGVSVGVIQSLKLTARSYKEAAKVKPLPSKNTIKLMRIARLEYHKRRRARELIEQYGY